MTNAFKLGKAVDLVCPKCGYTLHMLLSRKDYDRLRKDPKKVTVCPKCLHKFITGRNMITVHFMK